MTHLVHHSTAAANPLQEIVTSRAKSSSSSSVNKGVQSSFADILKSVTGERAPITSTATQTTTQSSTSSASTAAPSIIAAMMMANESTAGTASTSAAESSASETADNAEIVTTSSTTSAAATAASATTSAATSTPGIEALVTAIVNGTFQPTYVTSASQLGGTTPVGTQEMPSVDYLSNQSAEQMAQLLGGTVVQMQPFGTEGGFSSPEANFIQLPNGMTFNAADVADYAQGPNGGANQLMASITSTINAGAAWTNYYKNGGDIPMFSTGYVGPPISGMTYPSSMIGADGNVINPAMQSTSV